LNVKIALIVLIIAIELLVALEVALGLLFGFGNPLIYVADEQIGYLLAPEQRTRRFGRRIQINQFSQRSQAISPKREPSTLGVLLLGDSIANRGWWTDQDKTISSMIQLVRYLISTITAFSKPVLKRICSHQHQSKFN